MILVKRLTGSPIVKSCKISSTKSPEAYLFQTPLRGSLIETGGLYQKGGKDDEIFAYGFRNPGFWNPESH